MQKYSEFLEEFQNEGPVNYWAKKAEEFTWFKKYSKVLDDSIPHFTKWFVGGEINLCYECLDKQIEAGHGDEVAFIFDSPYTKSSKSVTYKELLTKVGKLAGAISECGLKTGDHVLVYMPMIYETFTSMLACCRLGLPYYVLMGSYTEYIIAERIDDFQPKLAIVANGEFDGGEKNYPKKLLDKAIGLANHKINKCFVLQRPWFEPATLVPDRDAEMEKVINKSEPHEFVPVEANHPCFIIYTSGTTGKPKGIVNSTRGVAIQLLHDESPFLQSCLKKKITCWRVSTAAWTVGQIYLCYAALKWRLTSVVYEGPVIGLNIKEVYRILSTYEVDTAALSTGSMRYLLRQEQLPFGPGNVKVQESIARKPPKLHHDPNGKIAEEYQPFSLARVICGGAPTDVAAMQWASRVFNTHVAQLYGLTELGGTLTQTDLSNGKSLEDQPIFSSGKPAPGWDVRILREDGSQADVNELGKIVIKTPLPPAVMSTLYRNDELFVDIYLKPFPGYFDLKDNGKFDEQGYLYVLNRNDTVFKAARHRISCTSLEEVMVSHPDVAEAVVVTRFANKNEMIMEIPEGFFILKQGVSKSVKAIGQELRDLVLSRLGTFIPFLEPINVDSLPRTFSGKVARGMVQEMLRKYTGDQKTVAEIQDPTLKAIWHAMKSTERLKNSTNP